MKNRDELINELVLELQGIKTVDDLKTSEDLVVKSMERVFESSVVMFNDFLENIDSIPEEEKEPKILMFQDENFFLPPGIMAEMERLDNFPGGGDYMDAFSIEMEKRMDPYIEQYSECAEKLMKKLFGGVVDGMEDAMEGMADAMGDVLGDVAEGIHDDDENDPG